jgi:ABC-type bacteriocin/lantibiotic exporter with double-glycine peptidase domain
MVTPILTAWFAGTVIPSGDRGQLVILTGALVISAICSALFSLTSSLALQRTGVRAGARTMAAVWDRVLRLPASFFRHVNPADLALRVLSFDRAREALAGTLLAGA